MASTAKTPPHGQISATLEAIKNKQVIHQHILVGCANSGAGKFALETTPSSAFLADVLRHRQSQGYALIQASIFEAHDVPDHPRTQLLEKTAVEEFQALVTGDFDFLF